MFSYFSYQDAGTTGRFELTLFKDSTNDLGKGELIHSKKATKGWPADDWEGFFKKLDEALKK